MYTNCTISYNSLCRTCAVYELENNQCDYCTVCQFKKYFFFCLLLLCSSLVRYTYFGKIHSLHVWFIQVTRQRQTAALQNSPGIQYMCLPPWKNVDYIANGFMEVIKFLCHYLWSSAMESSTPCSVIEMI